MQFKFSPDKGNY